jgi:deoxyribodipyrimidine photo-lyase
MISAQRLHTRNDRPIQRGRYVLYWMQAAQRSTGNHALEYTIRQANDLDLPVLVVFFLYAAYPEANLRHFAFMASGIEEVRHDLETRGIAFRVYPGAPPEILAEAAREAALLVPDRGYTRIQRAWRDEVAAAVPCRTVEVETEVILPVEAVSPKEDYAAATFRPKIHRLLDDYLVPLASTSPRRRAEDETCNTLAPCLPLSRLLDALPLDRSVPPSPLFRGGAGEGWNRLQSFLENDLAVYGEQRNDPSVDRASGLSPYLHFGQIGPLEVALAVREAPGTPAKAKEAFLEELIVRRELSANFVFYNPRYDIYEGALPSWSRATLEKHRHDPRPYTYGLKDLENAATHDPYWNAAQEEMVKTGRMHNYMRMYWERRSSNGAPHPRRPGMRPCI